MGRFYQKTDANGSGNTNPNEAVGTAASESTVSGAEVKESTGMFPVMDALSPGFPVPDSVRHFSLRRFLIGIVLILIENSIGSVTDFAKDVGKSRQAVLNDKKYAEEILAFLEALREASVQRVIVVTKQDVQRTALSAVLDGHSSLSGASEVVRNAYGVEISKTSISRLLSALALHCHIMDALFTMENICTVAADEIFQGQTPIFTVIDLDSFYIACISDMPDRTAETWELTMRCLKDDSGLDPEVFITDNCGALQNGLSSAYED